MVGERPRRVSSGGDNGEEDIFWDPTFFEEESVSVSENCDNDNVPDFDFDSFEDQQEAQPQLPSFETIHCIFCKTECVAKFTVVNGVVRKVKCENLEGGSIVVKRQLKSLFIIRNILGVKEETCYKLLNGLEGQLHPELWINVCSKCDVKVENYYERVKEIARLERRSKTIVLELKRAIWESLNNGGGGDNEEEVEETDFDGVRKEIREEALVGFDPNQNQPDAAIVKVEQNDDLTIMIFIIVMFCVLFGDGRGRAQNPDVVPPPPTYTSSSSSPHSPPSPETATSSSEPLEAAATTNNNQEVVTDNIQPIKPIAVGNELNLPVADAEEEDKETKTLSEQESSTQPIPPPPIHTTSEGTVTTPPSESPPSPETSSDSSKLLEAQVVTDDMLLMAIVRELNLPFAEFEEDETGILLESEQETSSQLILPPPIMTNEGTATEMLRERSESTVDFTDGNVGMDTTTTTTTQRDVDRDQETDEHVDFSEPPPIPLDKITVDGLCQEGEVEPEEIELTVENEVDVEQMMWVEVGEVFQVKEEAPLPIPPPKPKLTRRKTVMKPQFQSERGPKCFPSAPRVLRKIKPRPIRGFGKSSHFSVSQTVTKAPSSSTPTTPVDKEVTTNSSVLSSQSVNPAKSKSKQQPQHNLLTREKRVSITNPNPTIDQQIQKGAQEYFATEHVQRHVDKEASHSSPYPTLANSSARAEPVIPDSEEERDLADKGVSNKLPQLPSSPHSPPSPETATGSSEALVAAATANNQQGVTDDSDDIRQTAVKRELNSTAAEEENEETGTLLEQGSSTQPILPPLIITNVRTATSSLLHAPVTEVLTSGSLPTQVHSPKAAHNDNYSSSHASPTATNSIMAKAAPVGMDTTTLGDDRVQETDDNTNFTEPRPIPLDNKIHFEGVCQEVEPVEIQLTGRNEVVVEKIMCVEVGDVFQVKEEAPLPIPPPKPKLTRKKTVMKPQLQSERGPKCWPSAPRVLRKIKPRPIRGFGKSSHFSVSQTVTEAPSSSTPSGDKEVTTNSSVLSSQSVNPAKSKSKQQPQHNLLTKEKRASITNPNPTIDPQIQKVVQEYFGNEYVQRHVDKEASHSSPNPTLANSSAKVKAVIPHSLPHSSPSSSSAPHCPPLMETRTDSSVPLEAVSTANSQQGVTDDSQPIKPTAVGSKLNSPVPVAELEDDETGTLSKSDHETSSQPVPPPPPPMMTNEGTTATSSLPHSPVTDELLTTSPSSSPTQVVEEQTITTNAAPSSELVNSPKPIARNPRYNLRTRHNIRSPGQTVDIARDQQVRNNVVGKSIEPMAVSNELNLPVADAEKENEETGTLLQQESSTQPILPPPPPPIHITTNGETATSPPSLSPPASETEAATTENSVEVVADDILLTAVGNEGISLVAEVEEPGTFPDLERNSPPLPPLPPPPPVISAREKQKIKKVKRKENNLVNCLKCPAIISKHLIKKHNRLHQVGGRGTPCPACRIYVDKSRVDFHRRSDKCLKPTNDIPESDDSRDSEIEEIPVVSKPIPLVDISDDEEGSNSSIQIDSEDDEVEVVGEVVNVDEDDEVLSDTDDSSSDSDIVEDEDSSESASNDPKDKEKGSSKEKLTDREKDSDSDDSDNDNDNRHQNPEQEDQSPSTAAEGVATLATVTENEVQSSSSSQPRTRENNGDELDLNLQQLVDSFEKVEGGSHKKMLTFSPFSSSRRGDIENTSCQIPAPAPAAAISVRQSKKTPHPNHHQETFLSFRISLKSLESNTREREEMRSLGEHLITERNNREMERSRENQTQAPSIQVYLPEPEPESDPFSTDSDDDWVDPALWKVDSKGRFYCKRCSATFPKSSEQAREMHRLLHEKGRGKTCPRCKMVVPFLNRHKLNKGECIKPPLPLKRKPTSSLPQKRREIMSKKKKNAAYNNKNTEQINVPEIETETETPSAPPDLSNQDQNEQDADLNGGNPDPDPAVAVFKCNKCGATMKQGEGKEHQCLPKENGEAIKATSPPPPPATGRGLLFDRYNQRGGKRFFCSFCRFSIPMKDRDNHETNECEKHPSFKGLKTDQAHYKCKECSAWIKPSPPDEKELHHHLELHNLHPSTKLICLVCKWVVDNICTHNEEWHSNSELKLKSKEWALRPNFWVVDATSSPNYIVFIKDKNLLKYKCQRCPAEEKTKWEMEKHSKFHVDGAGSTCVECGWLVAPGGMEEHEKRHSSSHLPRSSSSDEVVAMSSKQARRNEEKYWKCWQCGGSFPDAEKQEHWDLHKSGNGANCGVCKLMVRADLLAQHLAGFHPELGFTTFI